MARKKGERPPNLSMTQLKTFMTCPRQYHEAYLNPNKVNKTTYFFLLGSGVHDFIRILHVGRNSKQTPFYENSDRPFYYKTIEAAKKAWFGWYWPKEVLGTNHLPISCYTRDDPAKYCFRGWINIYNYWNEMCEAVNRPLDIEKPYTHVLSPSNISFTGTADMVRTISMERIAKLRPELIVDGKLHEDYHPVVIFDFKTGYDSFNPLPKIVPNNYDIGVELFTSGLVERLNGKVDYEELEKHVRELTSGSDLYIGGRSFREVDFTDPMILEDMAKAEIPLHNDIQPTAYTLLYLLKTGKKPIGFYFFNTEKGNMMFTFREDKDFDYLHQVIDYFIECYQANHMPRFPSSRSCEYCLFPFECRGDREILVSFPSVLPVEQKIIRLPGNEEEHLQQLSMDLKFERKKRQNLATENTDVNNEKEVIRIIGEP